MTKVKLAFQHYCSIITFMAKSSRIINRFLATEFLKAFGLVFFSILGIIVLFSIIQGTRSASSVLPANVMARMAIYEALRSTKTTLPLSVLISGSLTFWRLARSSELVIIRSVGLSVWRFLRPMLFVCIMLGVLNAAVISPLTSALRKNIDVLNQQFSLRPANPVSFSQSGLWLKERNPQNPGFMYAASIHKDSEKKLSANGIVIFALESSHGFRMRLEAERGILTSDKMDLFHVRTVAPDLSEEKFEHMEYPTSLSIERIEESSSEPDTFSFFELPGFIRFFKDAGFSARRHQEYFYSLLFMPLLLCAMLFISTLFSISPKRSQINLALKLTGGVLLGFCLFFLNQVISALGASGRLPLLAAVLSIPILSIMGSALVLLYKEDG